MKFAAGLAALATLAVAAPSGAPTPLDVKLEMVGNSQVKATISNNGKNNLKIFKVGTIFDNTSTEKARVAANGKAATFEGVRLRVATHGLNENNFQRIPAGKSVEVKFDVANTHDLSSGGKFDIFSSGVLQFAEETGTKLVGSVPYHSNKLNTHIDGPAAAAIRNARIAKRTAIQSDCEGERGDAVIAAEKNCVDLSNAAAEVAKSGPAEKVEEFFKDSSDEVRSQIADVLTKVAGECGTTDGGASQTFCTDANNDCADRVLAYTIPSQSTITYCDLFFNDLPALTNSCHEQDQATTVLHETTHLSEIAGTDDLGYGYDNIQKLSTQDSLNNADSYAVFANSIYAQC